MLDPEVGTVLQALIDGVRPILGGNLIGATEAGIRSNRVKIGNFMLVSVLGALAGLMEAFRINSIDPNIGGGTRITFTAIAAAEQVRGSGRRVEGPGVVLARARSLDVQLAPRGPNRRLRWRWRRGRHLDRRRVRGDSRGQRRRCRS